MIDKIILKIALKIYPYLFDKQSKTWQKYSKFIKKDSSVIIGPGAEVKIFNPPEKEICLLEIDKDSQIFGQIFILRSEAKISIGQRCQINGCSLVSAIGIKIGNDVMIAGGTSIWDNDSHSLIWEERMNDVIQCGIDYRENPENWIRNKNWKYVKMNEIYIQDKVWIGINSVILKGVIVGEGAIIGAGSVVTKNVPPYTIVAGNPARIIKKNCKDQEMSISNTNIIT